MADFILKELAAHDRWRRTHTERSNIDDERTPPIAMRNLDQYLTAARPQRDDRQCQLIHTAIEIRGPAQFALPIETAQPNRTAQSYVNLRACERLRRLDRNIHVTRFIQHECDQRSTSGHRCPRLHPNGHDRNRQTRRKCSPDGSADPKPLPPRRGRLHPHGSPHGARERAFARSWRWRGACCAQRFDRDQGAAAIRTTHEVLQRKTPLCSIRAVPGAQDIDNVLAVHLLASCTRARRTEQLFALQ
jgi:hypothetical protein